MNYLLDTCAVSDYFKKIPSMIAQIKKVAPNQIGISAITVMEVEYGLRLNAEREVKIRPVWELLLKQIETIPYTSTCAASTAYLRAYLKKKGSLIGSYDLLIAGTALTHDLCLITSNMSEFNRVPSLKIEDWRM